jgi:hypothetical protein
MFLTNLEKQSFLSFFLGTFWPLLPCQFSVETDFVSFFSKKEENKKKTINQ